MGNFLPKLSGYIGFILLVVIMVIMNCTDTIFNDIGVVARGQSLGQSVDVLNDNDYDGFPDECELADERDRTAFREWFCTIALYSYYSRKNFRDCAELVNYCFRESLKRHDSRWINKTGFLLTDVIPDVSAFNYPEVPILGTNVFRKKPGPFKNSDLKDNTFTNYATGEILRRFNMKYISKNVVDLLPGDVICFYQPQSNLTNHMMIFVGKINRKDDYYFVYHTGPIDGKPGEMRLVSLSELTRHPDYRWHPVGSNSNFLGGFRWHILD